MTLQDNFNIRASLPIAPSFRGKLREELDRLGALMGGAADDTGNGLAFLVYDRGRRYRVGMKGPADLPAPVQENR
jgi:hypothetical protein